MREEVIYIGDDINPLLIFLSYISLLHKPVHRLDVPTLKDSPVTFELEAVRSMETDGGEVFLCIIRNVLMDESLLDDQKGIEERIRGIAPVRTTCMTYFG